MTRHREVSTRHVKLAAVAALANLAEVDVVEVAVVVLKLVGLVIAARRRDENIGAARRKQPRPLLAPPFRPAAHPGARRKRNEDSGCRGEAGSESRGRGVPRLQSTNMFYMRTCTRVRDNLARHNELTLSYAKLSLQPG